MLRHQLIKINYGFKVVMTDREYPRVRNLSDG